MVKNDCVIVEVAELRLDCAIEMAEMIAQEDCLLKIGFPTLAAYLPRLHNTAQLEKFKELLQGRLILETHGSYDSWEIMTLCRLYQPRAICIDYPMWEKFFPFAQNQKFAIPAYGSFEPSVARFDPRLAHKTDCNSNRDKRVPVCMAQKLLDYGGRGIIVRNIDQAMAVRQQKDIPSTFSVICRIEEIDEIMLQKAVAADVNGFMVNGSSRTFITELIDCVGLYAPIVVS